MPELAEPRARPKTAARRSFAFKDLFNASPVDRVSVIKAGVSARNLKLFVRELDVDQKVMFGALNLKTATVNRKAAKSQLLSIEDSERVVGLAKLVGQLEAMIEESGDPVGFNATEWLSTWLREPLPALGGGKPIDLLDTMEGQAIVARVLAQIQSGAYA